MPSATDIAIRLHIDDITAVAYINKDSGTHSKTLNDQASYSAGARRAVLGFRGPCSRRNQHDQHSRRVNDSSKWRLARCAFELVPEKWPVDTDLFTSTRNRQLPRFVSWRPQPDAFACNVFSLSSLSFSFYCRTRRPCYYQRTSHTH